MVKNIKNHKKHQRGQAMIELAMALPLLLAFLFSVSEFSALFVKAQRASSLSREAASLAYRDCNAFSADQLNFCLEAVATQISSGGDKNLLPGLQRDGKVIVSLYEVSSDLPMPVLKSARQSGGGAYTSRFSPTKLQSLVASDLGVVVVAEVFCPISALTPIQALLNLTNFPEEVYEATVI